MTDFFCPSLILGKFKSLSLSKGLLSVGLSLSCSCKSENNKKKRTIWYYAKNNVSPFWILECDIDFIESNFKHPADETAPANYTYQETTHKSHKLPLAFTNPCNTGAPSPSYHETTQWDFLNITQITVTLHCSSTQTLATQESPPLLIKKPQNGALNITDIPFNP